MKEFTWKSFGLYALSLICAQAAYLQISGIKSLHEITFNIVMGMIVTAGGVTLPWTSYSPLSKPLGNPGSNSTEAKQ